MPTLTSGQRRGKIPAGLLGMLLLVLLTERYIAQHNVDYKRSDYWDWRSTSRAAGSNVKDCQVLCLGTSRIQQSVLPNLIEAGSGLRTWNLAMCWGQAPASYFLLKRALDSGAKPKALLVEYHQAALQNDIWSAQGFWPELLNYRETLELGWADRNPSWFLSTTVAHSFASVQDRAEIRAEVLASLEGKSASNAASTLTAMRNRNVNRGAYVFPSSGGFKGTIGEQYQGAFYGSAWTCSDLNRLYIQRLLELASAKGIHVYWVLPPFAPELQDKREKSSNAERYTEFVQGWMEKYPNLSVLDGEHSAYEPNVFFDAAHLDRKGAVAFSTALAAQLKADRLQGATERWVRLPSFRDEEPHAPVEDLMMSQAYLQSTGKLRR